MGMLAMVSMRASFNHLWQRWVEGDSWNLGRKPAEVTIAIKMGHQAALCNISVLSKGGRRG